MKKYLPIILIAYFLGCLLLILALARQWQDTGQAPEQPIAFSHPIHAGNLRLYLVCPKSRQRSSETPTP